jgi:hypothetical protein
MGAQSLLEGATAGTTLGEGRKPITSREPTGRIALGLRTHISCPIPGGDMLQIVQHIQFGRCHHTGA